VIVQRDQFGDLAYARRADPELTPVALAPHETWVTDTAGVLAAFLDHLIDHRPLACSGRDHLRSLAMVEACVRSSAEGVVVTPRSSDRRRRWAWAERLTAPDPIDPTATQGGTPA
jgi:predicted dehydrogenase